MLNVMSSNSSILDIVLLSVSTAAFYFLSNYHTYNIGTSVPCAPPLLDFFHDVLPDLSDKVKWRDYILPLFFVPIFWTDATTSMIFHFIEGFSYIVTLKAITIFFTFLPPSNPRCAEKKEINHCFHQMFSGHNSLVVLLCMLYIKYIKPKKYHIWFIIVTVMYSCFILMTRAHYTVDIIVSYIIVLLLFQSVG